MDLPDDTLVRARRLDGRPVVSVGPRPMLPADRHWQLSLCLRNLSPAGPDWGHCGPAVAQLALALLLLVTDSVEAEEHYYLFQHTVLAGLRSDHWTIRVADLRTWLDYARSGKHVLLSRSTPQEDGAEALIFIVPPDSPSSHPPRL